MTSDVENLILVHLREMRAKMDSFEKRMDGFEARFDSLDKRFDELRGYVSFALGQGQMNFLKSNELEEITRAHTVRLAEIERRLGRVEERTE